MSKPASSIAKIAPVFLECELGGASARLGPRTRIAALVTRRESDRRGGRPSAVDLSQPHFETLSWAPVLTENVPPDPEDSLL
jgi:hypothetical protein